MITKRIYLVLICLLPALFIKAQVNPGPSSNLRKKNVSARKPVQKLDSLSIAPNTVIIQGVPATAYRVDEVNATITWLIPPPAEAVL